MDRIDEYLARMQAIASQYKQGLIIADEFKIACLEVLEQYNTRRHTERNCP